MSKLRCVKLPIIREWSVYMVKTSRDNLYTGVSKNVERRVYDHNNTKRGAKCLVGQRPVELVWSMDQLTKSEALKFERKLKNLSREDKDKFLAGDLPLSVEE